jgi:hypothetical protein
MIKYTKLRVKTSELFELEHCVPEWEVPIVQAVHSARDGVTIVDTDILVDRPLPEAADEFTRLVTRYRTTEKEDGSRGIPFVAAVYGEFGIGTRKLAEAIQASYVDAIVKPVDRDLLGQTSSVGG